MTQKPFEEYSVGETFESYARTVTETDIVNFVGLARLKAPIFIDEEFCKQHTPFKTRIAPGLLTAAFAAGMLEDILGQYTIAGLGIEKLTFTAPVLIGDTLRSRVTVEQMRPTSDGKRGILSVLIRTVKQDGTVVMEFATSFMMRKGRM